MSPFLTNLDEARDLQYQLKELGIVLDMDGHLFYDREYKAFPFSFELAFVRHGETYGNCGQSTHLAKIDYDLVRLGVKDREKRIYQGNVDTEINQLTEEGKKQANQLAITLEEKLLNKGWKPDVILHSPLTRAKETGLPFVERHGFNNIYLAYDDIREMQFGSWENRRICDLEHNNPCHLFYMTQHALIKNSGMDVNSIYRPGESFSEVLLRAYRVLLELEKNYSGKKILIFSHSMFGSACKILLGKGEMIENGNYLAFDGKRSDGTYYTMPFASPFLFK